MTTQKFIRNNTALITLIAACLVVLISLSVRQVFGMFFMDFNTDLGITNTEFGLAIGIQMLGWGLSGPIFGAIADKYGGHKAISLAFLFYILGIYFLFAGPNTGIYFQMSLGVLIGIGCGGTAISIPMSVVGKHFPLSNRTIAMSIVTAVGSFGYFISPLFTNYSLENNGWVQTLIYFMIFLIVGLIVAFFVRSPNLSESLEKPTDQNTLSALKEAFQTKSYVLLVAGFFVCGFHITLVGTHVPKYVIDRGLDDWTAAMILSLIGLFNIFGSLLSGYLSTKMSKKIILSAIYLLRGVSIIYFIFLPPSVFNCVVFGVTFGFLWLSTVPPTNGIVGHIFGTKYVGLLYGIVFVSHQIGSFLGAYLGGIIYENYGNFDYAWYVSIALSVFAGLIHLPIIEKAIERAQPA